MGVISARIPEDLEKELEEYVKEEKLEKSVAVRKLLSTAIAEWRRNRALKLLSDGKVSFLRAVEISGLDAWSFAEFIEEKKIPWIKTENVLKDLE